MSIDPNEKDWEARHDWDTPMRAREIESDPSRVARAREAAEGELRQMQEAVKRPREKGYESLGKPKL